MYSPNQQHEEASGILRLERPSSPISREMPSSKQRSQESSTNHETESSTLLEIDPEKQQRGGSSSEQDGRVVSSERLCLRASTNHYMTVPPSPPVVTVENDAQPQHEIPLPQWCYQISPAGHEIESSTMRDMESGAISAAEEERDTSSRSEEGSGVVRLERLCLRALMNHHMTVPPFPPVFYSEDSVQRQEMALSQHFSDQFATNHETSALNESSDSRQQDISSSDSHSRVLSLEKLCLRAIMNHQMTVPPFPTTADGGGDSAAAYHVESSSSMLSGRVKLGLTIGVALLAAYLYTHSHTPT